MSSAAVGWSVSPNIRLDPVEGQCCFRLSVSFLVTVLSVTDGGAEIPNNGFL